MVLEQEGTGIRVAHIGCNRHLLDSEGAGVVTLLYE